VWETDGEPPHIEALKAEGFHPSLANAVNRAVWEEPRVPGFGKVLVERCREWCGFTEGME